MAEGMNHVTLVGHVGGDPKLRSTSNPCLSIRLATTESWSKDGERKKKTAWHNVTVWGNRATALANIIKSGDQIGILGRIEYSEYEKEGVTMYSTQITAHDVKLLGSKQRSDGGQNQGDDDGGWPAG